MVLSVKTCKYNYLYPAKIFIKDDLPAPLGPIIADRELDLNLPETHFRIVLLPVNAIIKNPRGGIHNIFYVLPTKVVNCKDLTLFVSIWHAYSADRTI